MEFYQKVILQIQEDEVEKSSYYKSSAKDLNWDLFIGCPCDCGEFGTVVIWQFGLPEFVGTYANDYDSHVTVGNDMEEMRDEAISYFQARANSNEEVWREVRHERKENLPRLSNQEEN
jgi:hypothetical protein